MNEKITNEQVVMLNEAKLKMLGTTLDIPEGVELKDAKIMSPLGVLQYSRGQFRDGQNRWVTGDGVFQVITGIRTHVVNAVDFHPLYKLR